MKMRKLAALQLTVLFSALYLAACSNSVSEYADESGDVAQETESSSSSAKKNEQSSSSAKIESSSERPIEVVSPCKTETEDNCEYGSLIDERDGQVYKTVKIGSQWWMAENLNYGASFRYCRDDDYYIRSGVSYRIKDALTACPRGWHLPSKKEFDALIDMVGGARSNAGRVLSSNKPSYCETCGKNTDDYGFSAVALIKYPVGDPELMSIFWSSSEGVGYDPVADEDVHGQLVLKIDHYYGHATVGVSSELNSVRCVKDSSETLQEPDLSRLNSLPCADTSTHMAKRCRMNSKEDNCEYGTLTDERDGRVYKTVKIGEQWWMAENLKFRYLQKTDSLDSSSVCYKDSLENCEKYGRHYLWSAMMDSAGLYSSDGKGCGNGVVCSPTFPVQGVCPTGWHVPSLEEWEILEGMTYPNSVYEGFDTEGPEYDNFMLKSVEWGGKDRFGFNGQPTSCRTYNGYKNVESCGAMFWTTNICKAPACGDPKVKVEAYDFETVGRTTFFKNEFLAVRCIKD